MEENANVTKSKRVACYSRVSTAGQGTGLEAQTRALREYCSRMGVENYVIFEDENQSGVKSSRPALDRIMEAVRRGDFDTVAVYSFSRYARSTTHLLRALEEFRKRGISFISLSENIDTDSPLGTAIFTILSAVAQLERDILIERVRNGLANARAKGVIIGRRKTRPSELIRTLRRSGLSYSQIAKISNTSEGAIGAELKEWAQELARKGRSIADEQGDHRSAREAKIVEEKQIEDGPKIELQQPIVPMKFEIIH